LPAALGKEGGATVLQTDLSSSDCGDGRSISMSTNSKEKFINVQKLGENYKKIEEKGRKIQEIANEVTKAAAIGQKQLQFLRSELPKYEAVGDSCPEIQRLLPADDLWAQRAVEDSENALTRIEQAGSTLHQTINLIGTSVSTISVVGNMAVSGINWLSAQYPESQIFVTYQLQDPKPFFDSTDSEAVSKLLGEYDPELESERRGAWDAFYSSSNAKRSQSSHSMRDVLRKFISKHASNDAVKQAAWWTIAGDAKDGVSLKQRLRLLAYGPTADASQSELDFMVGQLEEFERSYELLNKAAHGSKQAETSIEASMKAAEQLLILILRRRVLTSDKQPAPPA